MVRAVVLIGILSLPTLAHADPSTYRCTFGEGITAEWEDGQFKTKSSSLSGEAAAVLVFDRIDAKKGTARVVGNAGAGDVMAIQTPSVLSFLEGMLYHVDLYGRATEQRKLR